VSLAVVIVSFNALEHLRACLQSAELNCPARIVVADNGSSDGSAEMVRREFPSVIVDVDPSNPGYGAGGNRGIRHCGSADVLLLNSDTRLRPGALGALERYLNEHPRAGIVGPRLLSPEGLLERSCFRFPSPLRPPLREDPVDRVLMHIPWLGERCLAGWSHDGPRIVPWVTGAALIIRRRTFDAVGGFDESFFMYGEEIDLCYRARQCGWETHFAPVADVIHVGAVSTRQRRAVMLAQGWTSAMQFYRRHYSGIGLATAWSVMAAAMVLRIVRDTVRLALAVNERRRRHLAENMAAWRLAVDREIHSGRRARSAE